VYDFLFVIIELFSLALTVETLQAEICQRERFFEGSESLRSPIRLKVEGDVAHQPLSQKTRRIALSCGIKLLPVGSLD